MNLPKSPETLMPAARALAELLEARTARIGIIGMGYVGQPLAIATNRAGFDITGFDVDPEKVALLNRGEQVLRTIPGSQIKALLETGRFRATGEMAGLAGMDVIIICGPSAHMFGPASWSRSNRQPTQARRVMWCSRCWKPGD